MLFPSLLALGYIERGWVYPVPIFGNRWVPEVRVLSFLLCISNVQLNSAVNWAKSYTRTYVSRNGDPYCYHATSPNTSPYYSLRTSVLPPEPSHRLACPLSGTWPAHKYEEAALRPSDPPGCSVVIWMNIMTHGNVIVGAVTLTRGMTHAFLKTHRDPL